ncbi:DUF3662 domain-containing protein [Streptomyces sp. NPDC018031]|uniref:DUF3662 domain-containing protein n=1 Tax=Streptomyces sp. NPDC018031 TaxID=3365033 RepID=UPI00378D63CE
MGALSRWERALERWEHALLGRAGRGETVELLEELRRECDDHAVVCSETRVVVPNAYDIELARAVHDGLGRKRGRVGQELTDALARHAQRKGYEFAGPLTVRVSASEHVPNGRYHIASDATPHVRADAFASLTG